MGFYSNLAATALRMLTTYGRVVQLGAGGTVRDVVAVRTKTIEHTHADSRVQIGDVEFILEAGANPVRMERLTTADDTLIVVHTDPIKPAGETVAWYAYGRVG